MEWSAVLIEARQHPRIISLGSADTVVTPAKIAGVPWAAPTSSHHHRRLALLEVTWASLLPRHIRPPPKRPPQETPPRLPQKVPSLSAADPRRHAQHRQHHTFASPGACSLPPGHCWTSHPPSLFRRPHRSSLKRCRCYKGTCARTHHHHCGHGVPDPRIPLPDSAAPPPVLSERTSDPPESSSPLAVFATPTCPSIGRVILLLTDVR